MANKPKNNKTYTLSLDADLIKTLDKICEKERRTRSSAIELAVEMYIARARKNEEATNG